MNGSPLFNCEEAIKLARKGSFVFANRFTLESIKAFYRSYTPRVWLMIFFGKGINYGYLCNSRH